MGTGTETAAEEAAADEAAAEEAARKEKEQKEKAEQEIIATAGETTFFQLEGKSVIGVEMCAGCDVLCILLGMVASEKIKEEKKK